MSLVTKHVVCNSSYMNTYDNYSREELIDELQKLRNSLDSLSTSRLRSQKYNQVSDNAKADTENASLVEVQRNLLKTVMDSGSSTFWEYDVENDVIDLGLAYFDDTEDNKALPKYKKNPLVNMASFLRTIHPDDKDRMWNDFVQPILRGEVSHTKVSFRRLFEDRVAWLVTALRVSEYKADGTAKKVVCYSQDITEQIELSQRLHQVESENKLFEYAVNFSNDEIHALDASGRFVFMNKLMMDNFGFKPPISNYMLTDIDDEYPIERWINETVPAVREGRITHFDAKHDYPNGTVRRIEVQLYKVDDPKRGEIFWAFCRDIDQRLRQHQQIARLNTIVNSILEQAPFAFVVQDVNDSLRYLYFNKKAEQIIGMPAEYMLGKTDAEAYAELPRARDMMKAYQERVFAQKHVENYGVELYNKGKVKRFIINEIHQHLEIPESNLSLLVYIFWDVTEQHEKELELIRAKEADKLKSAFLANMSHEIRTPLNSIVGFSNLMAETDDPEDKAMFMEVISKNNDLLLQLISDILDFSKIESGQLQFHMQLVQVKDVCYEVFRSFSVKLPPKVKLIFDVTGHEPALVHADYNRLSQVLINLVSNALKFTDEGSVTISYTCTRNHVTVSVTDTGMGIPANKRSGIFTRFVKLNEFKQGTGLGLSISKTIIETLKGSIGFDSVEGKGSTFWFKLPLIQR